MYRQKKKITFLLFKFDWIKKKCYINMVCMANLMNQLNSILKKVGKILEPLLFFFISIVTLFVLWTPMQISTIFVYNKQYAVDGASRHNTVQQKTHT